MNIYICKVYLNLVVWQAKFKLMKSEKEKEIKQLQSQMDKRERGAQSAGAEKGLRTREKGQYSDKISCFFLNNALK